LQVGVSDAVQACVVEVCTKCAGLCRGVPAALLVCQMRRIIDVYVYLSNLPQSVVLVHAAEHAAENSCLVDV
jgi:hypothetical protein